MDAWIDRNHSIRNLALKDVFVFLTDDAVGSREEENLGHLAANVGSDVPLSRLVPFLTCKHTMEHCLLYADRAQSLGFEALTVVGGDTSVGPPRCVPHSYMLRQRIRDRQPGLSLGGWANPHRDARKQIEFLGADDFSADFYLTQVMSHHSVDRVETFLEECDREGLDTPGIFGVFYYWSAHPDTLERLGEFFPVPAEGLVREFGAGATPEEVLIKTLDALRSAGAEKVYISNLGHRRVQDRLAKVISRSTIGADTSS
jgi:5,10-methylenetetrahydrofolate reductase